MIFFFTDTPKAWLPPDLLSIITMLPRITRNMEMPARSATGSDKPFIATVLKDSTGLKPFTRRAPTTMPQKRDEYTSFVSRARKIAIRAGNIAQKVPSIYCFSFDGIAGSAGRQFVKSLLL